MRSVIRALHDQTRPSRCRPITAALENTNIGCVPSPLALSGDGGTCERAKRGRISAVAPMMHHLHHCITAVGAETLWRAQQCRCGVVRGLRAVQASMGEYRHIRPSCVAGRAGVRLRREGTHQLPHLVTRGVGALERRSYEVHLGVHTHLRQHKHQWWRRDAGRNNRNPAGLGATPGGKAATCDDCRYDGRTLHSTPHFRWRAIRFGCCVSSAARGARTVKLLASAAAVLNFFVPLSHAVCACADSPDHENFALGGLGMALACDLVGSGNHWLPPPPLVLLPLFEEEGGVFPAPRPVGGWVISSAAVTNPPELAEEQLRWRKHEEGNAEHDLSSIRSAAGAHPPVNPIGASACPPPANHHDVAPCVRAPDAATAAWRVR